MNLDCCAAFAKYNVVNLTVQTFADLKQRTNNKAHTIALVMDSLDDPSNTNRIAAGAYVFCPERQDWCRIADFPEKITLEEKFADILNQYFRSGQENNLISALLSFKDEIYLRAPKSDVDYQPWANKLSGIFMTRLRDFETTQEKDPMDLNAGFRTKICLTFCMLIEGARTQEDFQHSLFFHLACAAAR